MTRAPLLAGLLFWAAAAQAGDFWNGLWQNADQRGEQLMRQGDAAKAASTYVNPRRKAYAELLAGAYPQAARDFSAFDDSDAYYDRGNALARAGHLQQAIASYGAALARDPKNSDARRNRDLVASALRRQQPPPKPPSSGGAASGTGKSAAQSQTQGQSGGRNEANKRGSSATNPATASPAGPQDKTAQGKDNEDGSERKAGQAERHPAPPNRPKAPARAAVQPPPAGAANLAPGNAEGAAGSVSGQSPRASPETPVSERQLAQDQWLRSIPDDPGGLLRRKFMIEHMIRQQGTQR